MTAAIHRKLIADIAGDRTAIARGRSRIEQYVAASPFDEVHADATALHLETGYPAVEGLIVRVLRVFEGEPTGDQWHRELLKAAVQEIPHVRDPIVSGPTMARLEEALKFRRFIRKGYAYAAALDVARVNVLGLAWLQVAAPLDEDLDQFVAGLEAMAASLEQ